MKKQIKPILLLPILAVLIALLAALYLHTRPAAVPGEKSVSVCVVHGDGTTRSFQYQTRLDYLGELLLTEGLVVGEGGPYGLYIKEVDAEVADFTESGAYWALFEGDSYATQGVEATVLEDGDEFSLVYTLG